MLLRLIYVSRVARHVRFADAEEIASRAAERNAAQEITGLLIYTPSHFLQVLEGPEPAVRQTFLRICRDSRHTDVKVLDESPIFDRRFGQWAMRASILPQGMTPTSFDVLNRQGALDLLNQVSP